ncbi:MULTISPECIES: PucR family transcriptional regulator [Thermomonospora]|uniref:Transcriptional regulator, CdaR n=1 Tax=Thermomonospora curvata (strain ATCC 19995 / DSM 43183 / JCM 3096 / KCTC 9072 / NBRC 15933 / NCIMB 10081 / Henssen B9) TaxID=471852 RepID=D1AAP6_THECD|nr:MULTISPECIES: PucR family transcriptional regulator [Thermomonospora]ACY97056.1 transcriptional regulator, CdaR [Thermomonospora curvata DSM 43183]
MRHREGSAGEAVRPPRIPRLDPETERAIARAFSLLLPQVDRIAEEITRVLLETDPYWREQSPQLQADQRRTTREHVRRGIQAMAGLAPPEEHPVELWRETGRTRARQGVPLDRVLNAYNLGARTLWEALLRLRWDHKVDIDEHLLLLAGQRLWTALDVQNATLVEAYRRESARLQRRDLQRQQNFLDGLVDGRGTDPQFSKEAREALGVAPGDPVACVVALLEEPHDDPLRAPQDGLERLGVSSHWHVRGGTYFGLVCHGGFTVDELVEALRPGVAGRVGVAAAHDGVAGFATAYRLAARAAESLPRGSQRIVTVAERLPEVLVAGSPEVVPVLVRETVGPLLALPPAQKDMLLRTLAALLAHNGSATQAAQVLFCHRNTVLYRAKQIEALTGRDLQNARDRLELSLGMIAAGHDPGEQPPS